MPSLPNLTRKDNNTAHAYHEQAGEPHKPGMKPYGGLSAVPLPMTEGIEVDQYKSTHIIRNRPLTYEFMPLGYDRDWWIERYASANFWNFGPSLNPAHEQEYSPTGRIDAEGYARSVTKSNGINSNQFIWDSIPELENFPVSGHPEKVSQQYVLYDVEPYWVGQSKKSLHISTHSAPKAYGVFTDTSKSQTLVYQTPVTTLQDNLNKSSVWQRIKNFMIG